MKSYKDFLLLLESNMKYSDDFRKILSKMKSPIAKDLMEIEGKEVDTKFNYFKPTDNNNKVFYTKDDKFKPGDDRYKIIDNGQSFSGAWTDMQAKLGMIEPDGDGVYPDNIEFPSLPNGTIGKIVKSLPHPKSNYDVCYFLSDSGEKCIIGIGGLEKIKMDFPSIQKDDMNIGRVVRQVLSKVGKKYEDKEIEKFVNEWKSSYEYVMYALDRFELVEGEDIKHWYLEDRYDGSKGTLSSSCMRHKECQSFFKIYTENTRQVSMLILKSKNDEDKIVGRSIVWKDIEIDGNKGTFMDRIYTIEDYDVQLFIKYANSKGWYHKEKQDASGDCNLIGPNGEVVNYPKLYIKLEYGDFSSYPYMDTMKSLDPYRGRLTNVSTYDYWLESTDGGNGICEICVNTGMVECYECGGGGEVECVECGGGGEIDCSICSGEGEFDCFECEGTGEQECGECDGYGQVDCSTCYGSGKNDEDEDCSDCGRSGKEECPNCSGKGNVDCSYCDGNCTQDCSDCDGSGKEDCPECYNGYITCNFCGGNGQVSCVECN